MLQQQHRFHGHGSLKFLYKNGQTIRSPFLLVKYIKNPHRKSSRFTVVVSKKITKSAVKRNTLRRRIYEIIRLSLPNIKNNYDVAIIVIKESLLEVNHQNLNNLIKQVFSQAKLYK